MDIIAAIQEKAERVLDFAFEDMTSARPALRMDGAFAVFEILMFDSHVMRRLHVAASAERMCLTMTPTVRCIDVHMQAYCTGAALLDVMNEYDVWVSAQRKRPQS